ncbi:MAG: hypothetical protein M3290_01930 [Actinomycetota bacterium]|nr:hypothetical protein [Actinomycetota bacterium]
MISRTLRLLAIVAAVALVASLGAESNIYTTLRRSEETAAARFKAAREHHPEEMAEMKAAAGQQLAIQAAPGRRVAAGSFFTATQQAKKIKRHRSSPADSHVWHRYGKTPLNSDIPGYTSTAGYGLEDLSGRITNYALIPATANTPDVVIASESYGGVWETRDLGKHWFSIGNKLPTQVVGAVGYTKARGGTIIAVTGDGSFGRYSRAGAGAYWTNNNGKRWHHSRGIPSNAFAFKVAVDQAHPKIVYAATGGGLFRSTNAGRSFRNVKLPTGPCAGKPMTTKFCLLANQVTDVVVQQKGGASNTKGGAVLAAVGWRDGAKTYPNGKPQSPRNGLYSSPTGKPGSFKKLDPAGFAPQPRIGRVALGEAIGSDQDHNYVYAAVQDAVLDQGGTPAVDFPGGPSPAHAPTVFNGIYVSNDFGQTWVEMADESQLQQPASGSALAGVAQSSNYGPGVQSWYNLWIQPDPTRQVGGVPTRLLFGLEEVWMNDDTQAPQTGPSSFHVVGRYYAGSSCLFLQTGLPVCPTNRDEALDTTTTTHPDQHAALFVPHKDGGVTLFAGNDGGAYTQTKDANSDFDNAGWGNGAQTGLNTLLPYDAVIAGDGTAYAGLQDNGTEKIGDLKTKSGVQHQAQIEVYGGDGFFVGVDPHNSNTAYEEYVYGAMSGTKDGGKTWGGMTPPGMNGTTAQFSNPFAVDPADPNHVMIAGNQVDETGSGTGTSSSDWYVPFHLGTAKHPGSAKATATDTDPLNQESAIDLYKSNAYVGYCGVCSVLNVKAPFKNGIATNVGGSGPPKRYVKSGWHIAKARGLPNRYITGLAMNHGKPKHVFASLGGYIQPWMKPGQIDKNPRLGKGHVYYSKNAGKSFVNVDANLPNVPVNWITLRGKQVIVATDVGVFISKPHANCTRKGGCKFEALGKGLPTSPVFTVRVAGCDKNLLTAAVYGRGVYTYRFGPKPPCPAPKPPTLPKFENKKIAGPFGFETGDDGWKSQSTNAQQNWTNAPPGDNSSQSMQIAPYQNDSSTSLVSPKFKVPEASAVKIGWSVRMDTEDCCDYLALQWTSDGFVWHTAWAAAGQNADFPNFTHMETKPFYVPKGTITLRFTMTSDQLVSSPPYTGVAVDNVTVSR